MYEIFENITVMILHSACGGFALFLFKYRSTMEALFAHWKAQGRNLSK
jgi:hypothetical protein